MMRIESAPAAAPILVFGIVIHPEATMRLVRC